MSARLFIRNDDACKLDSQFRFFFDLAIDNGIPIIHAVIPGKIDAGTISFLCRAKEKTPHLLDIVQHGWMHTNHSLAAGAKYEFGKSRSLKSQREDIKQGLIKMRSSFGEHFTPAFVPPYHGYDERTLEVLEEDFKVFSAGMRRSGKRKKFLEVPAQISFTEYLANGERSIRTAASMIEILAKAMHQQPLSGVVTHHADFKTKESQQELARFFGLINALKEKEEWRVLLFSDLVRK